MTCQCTCGKHILVEAKWNTSVAKQNIALNAAHEVLATTQPTAPAGPSVNDLKAQVAELVRTRDDANALLAQLGALANPNPTLPLSGVT